MPPDSPPPLRVEVTSQNGEISCSVEETNRIRRELGLKPLRIKSTEPVPATATPVPAQTPTALQDRLSASRRSRQKRNASMAARSLAQPASDSDDEADDDEMHIAHLTSWVQRTRQSAQPTSSATRTANTPASGAPLQESDAPLVEERKSIMHVRADAEVPSATVYKPREGSRSTPISRDGMNSLHLTNQTDGKDRAPPGTGIAKLREKNHIEEPKALSVASSLPVIESDYKEEVAAPFKRRKGRKESKKPRKKRRRTHGADDVSDPGVNSTTLPPVSKGHMQTARAEAAAAAELLRDDSDDDAHYASLARTRRLAREKKVHSSVDTILQAIERVADSEGKIPGDGGEGEDFEESAKIVYNEMEQFLRNIPSAPGPDSESEPEALPPVDDARDGGGEVGTDDGMEAGNSGVQPEVETAGRAKEGVGPNVQPVSSTLGLPEDPTGGKGLAGALQQLRARGELKHKAPQRGRARDERYDAEAIGGGGGSGSAGREIKLSYLDEFGNQLTPKEAFRLLCHKFHGKGPGQNKKEKRLRKMLETIQVQSMQSDDTPLASAAALRKETKKLGSSHVVLSGSHALLRQTPERPVLAKMTEKRKREDVPPGQEAANGINNGETDNGKRDGEDKKVTFSFGVQGLGARKRHRR